MPTLESDDGDYFLGLTKKKNRFQQLLNGNRSPNVIETNSRSIRLNK